MRKTKIILAILFQLAIVALVDVISRQNSYEMIAESKSNATA